MVSDISHFRFFPRCFFPIVQPNIAKLKPKMSPFQVSDDAKQLIKKLLEMKPADRFTAEQAEPGSFCVPV